MTSPGTPLGFGEIDDGCYFEIVRIGWRSTYDCIQPWKVSNCSEIGEPYPMVTIVTG